MPRSATIAPEIQFANLSQQGETSQLGMWVFLRGGFQNSRASLPATRNMQAVWSRD